MFRPARSGKPEYRCSFCGKSQEDVRRLIAGPGSVYICDECVELCREIIDEEELVISGKADSSLGGRAGGRWQYNIKRIVRSDGLTAYKPTLTSREDAVVAVEAGQGTETWRYAGSYEAIDGYLTVEQAKMAVKHLMEHEMLSDDFDPLDY